MDNPNKPMVEKDLVEKICDDLLNNRFKKYEDMQSLWGNTKIKNKFLEDILDSTSEFFVVKNLYPLKDEFENSYEFLCIYAAQQVLKNSIDLDNAETIYRNIFKIDGLTKRKIKEYLHTRNDNADLRPE